MSYAPKTLLDVRDFMQAITGLPDNALGIVADQAHDGGYHCGWDRRRIRNGQLDDYSWEDASRDLAHKTNAAAAFDLGKFEQLLNGAAVSWIDFSVWLVGQCEANRNNSSVAQDCADIRSIIYTRDERTVVRWDRLRIRSGGDSSHLTHTHISYFRDAENRDKLGPYRRFFRPYMTRGDDVLFLQVEGQPEVYVSDTRSFRHVKTNAALQAALAATGQDIAVVQSMEQLRDVGGVPEAEFKQEVTLTTAQIDELANKIASRLVSSGAVVSKDELRDAVADLGEGGAKQVREDL